VSKQKKEEDRCTGFGGRRSIIVACERSIRFPRRRAAVSNAEPDDDLKSNIQVSKCLYRFQSAGPEMSLDQPSSIQIFI
jgi:hypothetical protein